MKRKINKFLLVILVVILIPGCKKEKMDHYKENQLSINSVTLLDNNQVKINYSSMLETLYYSPGANVRTKSGAVYILISRCPINGACKVDLTSEMESASSNIFVKNNGQAIYLVSGDKKIKIFPQ